MGGQRKGKPLYSVCGPLGRLSLLWFVGEHSTGTECGNGKKKGQSGWGKGKMLSRGEHREHYERWQRKN